MNHLAKTDHGILIRHDFSPYDRLSRKHRADYPFCFYDHHNGANCDGFASVIYDIWCPLSNESWDLQLPWTSRSSSPCHPLQKSDRHFCQEYPGPFHQFIHFQSIQQSSCHRSRCFLPAFPYRWLHYEPSSKSKFRQKRKSGAKNVKPLQKSATILL